MKKTRFTESPDHGYPASDGERRCGLRAVVANMACAAPRSVAGQGYGGMDARPIRAMKAMAAENRRLKRMHPEVSMPHEIRKEAPGTQRHGQRGTGNWP